MGKLEKQMLDDQNETTKNMSQLFTETLKIQGIFDGGHKYKTHLPKGISSKGVERLKIEFRFMKHIFDLIQD